MCQINLGTGVADVCHVVPIAALTQLLRIVYAAVKTQAIGEGRHNRIGSCPQVGTHLDSRGRM